MKALEPEEIEPFMTQLYELKTEKYGLSPLWGYGWYVVKVTYANGDIEMLGSYNIGFIPDGAFISGVGIHYFADRGLENRLANYVDLSEYPEKK